MSITFALFRHAVRVHSRTPGYYYTMLFTPLLMFFIYTGIFAGGEPQRVLYFLGPSMVLMATMNGLYGLGGDLLIMRQAGTLAPYRLTPIGGAHIIMSRLVIDVVLTVAVGTVMVLLAIGLYGVPIRANPYELVIVCVLGALALGTLGALIVEVANSIQEASMLSQVVFLSLLILSGLTMPLQNLPASAQVVAKFLPTTMLITSFHGVLIDSHRLVQHWREMVVLVLFILSTGTAAILLFRWDKEEKVRGRARAMAALSLAPLVLAGIWFNLG